MLTKKDAPIVTLAMLMLLAAAPDTGWRGLKSVDIAPANAQTATTEQFPMPELVAQGTRVRLATSDVAATLGQNLKQGFETRYGGTQVEIDTTNADAAISSVAEGRADVAAIGRPLTPAERQQGLNSVTIGRQKIAVVTSASNPIDNLSNEQFAQIFRGEITNWAEVGGANEPIRVIDQTADSGTRMSLSGYPVFQTLPFKAAGNAVTLKNNRASTIVAALGQSGIAYVIADQALERSDLKIIPLHRVMPNDPRYSFSQPMSYVYKGTTPNDTAQAFLGFATGKEGRTVAQIPLATGAAATATAATTPVTTVTTADGTATAAANQASAFAPLKNPPPGRTAVQADRGQGTALAARDTNQNNRQLPAGWAWVLLSLMGLPLLAFWLKGRKSNAGAALGSPSEPAAPATLPQVNATLPTSATPQNAFRGGAAATAAAGVAGIGAATTGVLTAASRHQASRIILVPRDCRTAYAYWEINEKQRARLQEKGGKHLKLRLYSMNPRMPRHLIREFDCAESDVDRPIAIAMDNHDYHVELGYLTNGGDWLKLAASAPVKVPACERSTPQRPTHTEPQPAPAQSNQSQVAVQPPTAHQPPTNLPTDADHQRSQPDADGQIILVPRDDAMAYAYWEVPARKLQDLPEGQKLNLRLYDVTGAEEYYSLPRNYQQFDCAADAKDMHLPLPATGRDYVAQMGYTNAKGEWVTFAHSHRTHIPQPVKAASHQAEAAALMGTIVQHPRHSAMGHDTVQQPETMHHATVQPVAAEVDETATQGHLVQGRLVIMSQIPQRITVGAPNDSEPRAYVYWDIPEPRKAALRQRGGHQMVLRIYDATNIDLDYHPAHSFRQYPIDEQARDMVVSVPQGDRDYVAEIGYLAPGGKLMRLLRSTHTHVPPVTQMH